jgi:hypothetical protein
VSDIVIQGPVALIFVYLTLPIFFNPEIVVVVMGVLFFIFFRMITANLKKFL